MAVALVGTIGTAVQSAAGGSASPTFGTGESRTAGNLLVLTVSGTGAATLPATPTGWTLAKQVAGTNCSASVFIKVAEGSDAAPVIAGATSVLWGAQLSEWSGTVGTVNQSGSTSGTTSPQTATAGAADTRSGALWLAAGADRRSGSVNSSDTWTSNHLTPTLRGNNNGNTQNHYSFASGATTSAVGADTAVMTLSVTTNITGLAVAMATVLSGAVLLKTFTLDATLKSTPTGSFSLNAIIKATLPFPTLPTPLNAVIKRNQTSSFTANAVLKRTQSSSFLLDAVLKRYQSSSFSLDAIIRTTPAGSFSLDADLKRTQSGSFALDADLQRAQSGSSALDAVLQRAQSGSFSLNAVLQRAQSGSFALDADIQRTQFGSFALDADLQRAQSGSFSLDAVLLQTFPGAFSLDAAVLGMQLGTFSLDAITQRVATATIALDSIVSRSAGGTFALDAVVVEGIVVVEGSFAMDAVRRRTVETAPAGPASLGGVLGVDRLGSFELGAVGVTPVAPYPPFTLDAIIRRPVVVGSFTLDATISIRVTSSFTLDALLRRPITSSFTLDAIQGETVGVIVEEDWSRNVVDGWGASPNGKGPWALLNENDGVDASSLSTIAADNEASIVDTANWILDSEVGSYLRGKKQLGTKVMAVVSLLSANNLSNPHTATARVYVRHDGKTGPLDSINSVYYCFELRFDWDFSLHARIRRSKVDVVADWVDTGLTWAFGRRFYLLAVAAKSNPTLLRFKVWQQADPIPTQWLFGPNLADSAGPQTAGWIALAAVTQQVVKPISWRFGLVHAYNIDGAIDLDAVIKRSGVAGSFTLKAVTKRTPTGSFTLNAALSTRTTSNFTLDALLRRPTTGSFTLDAFIRIPGVHTFSLDAIARRAVSGTFTADAIVQGSASGTFTLNAWIAGNVGQSFTLDATLRVAASGTFPVNAIVRGTAQGHTTLDAAIEKTETGSFTLAALLRVTRMVGLSLDAVVLSHPAAAFRLDAVLLRGRSGSFSLDAIRRIRVDASLTVDAWLLRQQAASFSLNAVVFRAGITQSFTLSAVVTISRPNFLVADLAARALTSTIDEPDHLVADLAGRFLACDIDEPDNELAGDLDPEVLSYDFGEGT